MITIPTGNHCLSRWNLKVNRADMMRGCFLKSVFINCGLLLVETVGSKGGSMRERGAGGEPRGTLARDTGLDMVGAGAFERPFPGQWLGSSGKGPSALCLGLFAGLLALGAVLAHSEAAAEDLTSYHTPLAGEGGEVTFLGKKVLIPGQDRSQMTSITLGASLLAPQQGDTSVLPVAAFYHRRIGEATRTRNVVSVFVNELEYDQEVGDMELVVHFENHTLPQQQRELAQGREVVGTSLYYGTLLGSVGAGWRLPVQPFQVDNALILQLLGRVGYFYAERGDDAAPGLFVPPDTILYGARARARYDGLRRNLLELPHEGLAAGFELDYLHRDRWRFESGVNADGGDDYLQISWHLEGVADVPGGTERDRLLFYLYGGHTMNEKGDRFNAFRINGATFPSEADDLAKPHYAGVVYNSALATSYATVSAGYRRELTFFLYLTLLGSYFWGDRATAEGTDRVVFAEKDGVAATVAVDSAFFWNSSLYFAYSWESGIIRNGRHGSGVALIWNKLL